MRSVARVAASGTRPARRCPGAAGGISPAWTSVSNPAGKTTLTVLPGVESVAKAQTGNDASAVPDADITGRGAAAVDEREGQPVLRGLAAVDPFPEREVENRELVGLLRDGTLGLPPPDQVSL